MDSQSGKLAVILHADVAGSTQLVQQDEHLAHERIQLAFKRFEQHINDYRGHVLELRGDALIAEFERASDAVSAALAFQLDHGEAVKDLDGDLIPRIRIGVTLGEVVMADNTITGAGVVLAQRVEQLADPGGVCISSAVHEALPKRMPFNLENMGEHDLQGFEEPVRIYKVSSRPDIPIPPPQSRHRSRKPRIPGKHGPLLVIVLVALVAGITYKVYQGDPLKEPALATRMALPLPDKPSIAVLPFVNMSDDKSQEYFVDGMTEDLITDISKIPDLFVIARNSVFTYKDKAVKVRQVAEELGVRYVLEGSVRKVGDQVRINAQLIDATTGGHLWAERYDGSMADVFALQDQVSNNIVSTLAIRLTQNEQNIIAQRETDNAEAYDIFLRGWEQYLRQTPESFRQAITLFEKAIELDPNYSRAYAAISLTLWQGWRSFWFEKLGYTSTHDIRFAAEQYLAKAMREPTPLALQISTAMHAQWGRFEDAITEGERAIAMDPNDSDGYVALAHARTLAGDPHAALPLLEKAIRLNPRYPTSYLYELGLTRFCIEDYAGAGRALEQALTINPDDRLSARLLIATLGHLNRESDTAKIIEWAERNYSGYDPLSVTGIAFWYPFKNPVDVARLAEGLRKAGIPD